MKFAFIYMALGLFVVIGCNMRISCGVSHNLEIGLTVLEYIAIVFMIIGIFISFLPQRKTKKSVNYISKITW
jgi:uncharacterized membrane protein YgdD (TMEM256/DUF423 family)